MFEMETQRERFHKAGLEQIVGNVSASVSEHGYGVIISVLDDKGKPVYYAMAEGADSDNAGMDVLDVDFIRSEKGNHFVFDESYSARCTHKIRGADAVLQSALDKVVKSTGELYRVMLALFKNNRIHYLASAKPVASKYAVDVEMIPDFEELLGEDTFHLLSISEPKLREEVEQDIASLAAGSEGTDFSNYFARMAGTKRIVQQGSKRALSMGSREIRQTGETYYTGKGNLNRAYVLKGNVIYTQVATDKVEQLPVATISYRKSEKVNVY